MSRIVTDSDYIVISSGNDKQIGTLLRKRVNQGKASFIDQTTGEDAGRLWLMVERIGANPLNMFFTPHKGNWKFHDNEFDIDVYIECFYEPERFQSTTDASAESQWELKIKKEDFNRFENFLDQIIPKRYPEPEREHEFTTYTSTKNAMGGVEFVKSRRTIFPTVRAAVQPEITEIMDDIERFMGKYEWYSRRFIPHKRGYLMYGPPGTGKSTAIKMIGSLMEMDVYSISPEHMLNADTIRTLFKQVPEGSIILVEDIDTLFVSDRAKTETANGMDRLAGAALNALLQALDGLDSYNGSVFIATTNHVDRLDHAVLRAGRIDMRKEIGPMKSPQVEHFFAHFYDVKHEDYEFTAGEIKVADLMSTMLSHIEDQETAMKIVGVRKKQ